MHDTPTLPGMDDGPTREPTREREFGDMVYTVSDAHPEADRYPWLDDDELQELVDDIAENKGLDEPIAKLPDGRIVDGRNRELACLIAEVAPEYVTVDLPEDQIPGYVRRKNVLRRHLSRKLRWELIADALRENPEKSNNSIAHELKVSDKTVSRVREELESTSEIPKLDATKGRDGKMRPAKAKKPKPENASPSAPSVDQSSPTELPAHPFAELMDAVTKLAGDITRAMGEGTEAAVRLRDYLSWCGLVVHEGNANDTHAVFIQLKGVRHIIDMAGESGKAKTADKIKREWEVASGGVLVHPMIRRIRNERSQRKAGNG